MSKLKFDKAASDERRKEYKKKRKGFNFGSRNLEGGPEHVAVICDGNRRWAKENGLSVEEGHAVGAENVLDLLGRSGELGIETMTVWVMDTKNFKKRSKAEIKNLLKLFMYYAMTFRREYLSEDIRFRHLGARELLPKKIRKLIVELEEETAHKKQATLNVAFNYGGHDEILRAVKRIVEDGIPADQIDISLISNYLDTKGEKDPDMIIRTGREQRLSGFMPWQSVPSELFFPNYYFPEFTPDRYEETVREYTKRNKRFGA